MAGCFKHVWVVGVALGLGVLALLAAGCGPARTVSSPPWQGASSEHRKKLYEAVSLIDRNYHDNVDFDLLVNSAIEGMVKNLDPLSTYLTREVYQHMQLSAKGVYGGLGLVVSMEDGVLTVVSPIENTPAHKAGVLSGDVIIEIDGETARDLSINDAMLKLRGPTGSYATIGIMRQGLEKPKHFTMRREIIKVRSVRHRNLGEGVGYIRISSFQENTGEDLKKSLAELKSQITPLEGLIIDLRNNPGGLLDQAIDSADLLLEKGIIMTTRGRGLERVYQARRHGTEPEVPMVVLINRGSASGSEILAGALRDNDRALLLGTRTFGKGLMQAILPLRDGSALKLTSAEYFTPRGDSIDRVGLTPDFPVYYVGPVRDGMESLDQKDPENSGEAPLSVFFGAEPDLAFDNQVQRALELIKNWEGTRLHTQ